MEGLVDDEAALHGSFAAELVGAEAALESSTSSACCRRRAARVDDPGGAPVGSKGRSPPPFGDASHATPVGIPFNPEPPDFGGGARRPRLILG